MGKTFEEIDDEVIERIYGLKAVRKDGEVTYVESPEDVARKQAIREQQIRNDFRNELLDAEEEREKQKKRTEILEDRIQKLRSHGYQI